MTILERVLDYRLHRGWYIVPVEGKSPDHLGLGWQDLRLDEPRLRGYFSNGHGYNVGGILGPASGGLTDLDCDVPLAVRLAGQLAPPTRSLYGRPGKPLSHRLYVCDPPVHETRPFRAPDRSMLIELRAKGQSVLPGSTWTDPRDGHCEPVEWVEDGALGRAVWGDLLRATERIAAGVLLAPCWTQGSRHDFTLCLAGALLRRGWSTDEVTAYVTAIARAVGEEHLDTGKVWSDVRDTAKNLEADKKVSGLPTLGHLVGDRSAMDKICEWLHLERIAHEEPEPERTQQQEQPAPGAEAHALPVITFGEFAKRPHQPQRMLIEDLVPAEESTLLTGRERSFKSFFLMEQGICLALGQPFLGHYKVEKRARVLLFDLENNGDRLYDRIHKALVARGLDDASMDPYFLMLDREHGTERFWFTSEQLANMAVTLDQFKPDFVIVDNLRRAMPPGKTESDIKDMLPIMVSMCTMCEQRKIAITLAHHDRRDGTGASGSGALLSTPSNVIQLRANRDTNVSLVTCDSMRNCPRFESFGISVDTQTCTLTYIEPSGGKREEQRKSHADVVLEELAKGKQSITDLEESTGLTRRQLEPLIDALEQQHRVVFVGWGQNTVKGPKPKLYGLLARPSDNSATVPFINDITSPIGGGEVVNKRQNGNMAESTLPADLLRQGVEYQEQACIFCKGHLFRPSDGGTGWVCYVCSPRIDEGDEEDES